MADEKCDSCGDTPAFRNRKLSRWLCEDCAAELLAGAIPPADRITATRRPNVPFGVVLTSRQRQPGTGEGHDYFGNHT